MIIPQFTPEQQKENLKKGVEALRSNPLKATGEMSSSDGGRCCLCVLKDVAEDLCGLARGSLLCNVSFPDGKLAEVFGLLPNVKYINYGFDFSLYINDDYTIFNASELNDGDGCDELSHKEIADLIEKQYLV